MSMPGKNLFYCHGSGRGGDLIRFVELFPNLPFRQSIARLRQELAAASDSDLLEQAAAFYQLQLQRYSEGAQYLEQRGLHLSATIEELGIGSSPKPVRASPQKASAAVTR
jgi:DNA primase